MTIMLIPNVCETGFVVQYYYRPQTYFAKVMFLQVSVCPKGGACSRGVPAPGGCLVQGVPGPGGVSRPTPRGNLRGIWSTPTTKREVEGIWSTPTTKGKLRGIWSMPTPKGEVEGDLVQAHTQGGS